MEEVELIMFAFKPSKDTQLKFRSESSGSEDPDASKRTFNFDVNYLFNDSFRINFGLKNLMDFQYELFDGYNVERGRRFIANLAYSF